MYSWLLPGNWTMPTLAQQADWHATQSHYGKQQFGFLVRYNSNGERVMDKTVCRQCQCAFRCFECWNKAERWNQLRHKFASFTFYYLFYIFNFIVQELLFSFIASSISLSIYLMEIVHQYFAMRQNATSARGCLWYFLPIDTWNALLSVQNTWKETCTFSFFPPLYWTSTEPWLLCIITPVTYTR